jgi:Fe-S oxidoreductase
MTADELNASREKAYALALLRIAELERQLEAAQQQPKTALTTCPHCKMQYEHTLR